MTTYGFFEWLDAMVAWWKKVIILVINIANRALLVQSTARPLGDFCQNRRESYEITIREKG